MSYFIDFLLFRWLIKWPFVTVTVVTVVFLRVFASPYLYITIYILISYKYFRRGFRTSFFNCNNCNCNASAFFTFSLFYLFTFLPFFYQALQSFPSLAFSLPSLGESEGAPQKNFVQNLLSLENYLYLCRQVSPDRCRSALPLATERTQEMTHRWRTLSAGWWYDFCGTNNSISYLFRESWNLGNFKDEMLMNKSARCSRDSVGMTYILAFQVILGPQDSREESSLRFFCVLRSLGITCKQAWRYRLIAARCY